MSGDPDERGLPTGSPPLSIQTDGDAGIVGWESLCRHVVQSGTWT